MRVLTDYPERIPTLEQVYLARHLDAKTIKTFRIQSTRMNQEYMLLKLEGVDDRDHADRLRGLMVLVAYSDAVPLEAGEFYLYQVIGVEVYTEGDVLLGTVSDVLETGANDVYVLHGERGETLIPALPDVVLSVDIAARRMVVRLPEGLLDPEDAEPST